MKPKNLIFFLGLLLACNYSFAQRQMPEVTEKKITADQLTIEPAIGIHTNFGTDFLISNLVQWNPYSNLALASHSSLNINNPFQRDFNGIKTNYNYSINQKIGIGYTCYSKRSSYSFLLMAGARYTSFKETVETPDLKKVSVAISSFSPDYGLMYSLKKGLGKYFFTYRMYIPLYPWPIKGSNSSYLDGNVNNIALELGVGIKIK
ncbi:hypothetical protein [Flavobacterium sp. ZS1P14]|uniref:hypothetical protein n=1 Tax=Flavobacterium sp. ZS1P14 TaxID=3401729 RepID=UPI003AAC3AB1